MKIFYSWQMDTPSSGNKSLIRSALDKACKELNTEKFIDDAIRYDFSMQNVSGTPEVASTLFKQIDDSHAFLADLTLTGEVTSSNPIKRMFNPNVNLELGYAAGVLGWERIICVVNEAYGNVDEQPFDVRNRRFPIRYNFQPEGNNKADVITKLTRDIKGAIKAIEQEELRRVEEAIRRLDQDCLLAVHSFARMESFAIQSVTQAKNPEVARRNNAIINKSIRRLLDLDLVWTNHDSRKKTYGYHWSYLGNKVIEEMTGRTIKEIREGLLDVDALQEEISRSLNQFKH